MGVDESQGDGDVSDSPLATVDLSDPADRWQYCCPEGHRDWRPTNSHIYCDTCAAQNLDADHWTIINKRTDTELQWSAVTVEY